MGASSDNNPATDPNKSLVDLSELQSLSFGPNWTERKSSDAPKFRESSGRGGGGGGKGSRDRRSSARPERRSDGPSAPRSADDSPGGGRRSPRGHERSRDSAQQRDEFKPLVKVTFYPEDIPFKALSHAMKTNCRTYELFEIARLILGKPERFVVVLHPLDKTDGTVPQEFFLSVPDGAPFLSEEAVVAHVLKNHLERFFSTEEVEIEPPKGNFVSVGKCGITGELLGPPNYHRYQGLLQEHHDSRLPNMPFDRFLGKVEQVKDPEVVQQWLSQMTKVTRFRPLNPAENDPESLDGLEAARLYLLSRRREQVVRKSDHARFSGKSIETLPKGDLRRSVEAAWDYQQRFPLETANNLRGRLRRMRFTIYKRGSKGVSYVCAVKRNFRDPGTTLASSVQDLIEFIEKHPGVSLADLPKKFLGIKPEEVIQPEAEKAPDIEEVPREQAEAIVEEHEIRRQERLAAKEAQATTGTEEAVEPESIEETEANAAEAPEAESVAQVAAEAQSASEAAPTPAVLDPRLRQLMIDLHWLVHEGYVVEFGDGKLQAVPYAQVSGKSHADEEEIDDGDDPMDVLNDAEGTKDAPESF